MAGLGQGERLCFQGNSNFRVVQMQLQSYIREKASPKLWIALGLEKWVRVCCKKGIERD
jgi:hypothetical protein